MLGTYFYIIDISFDKTHFTYIWVNLICDLCGEIEKSTIMQMQMSKKANYLIQLKESLGKWSTTSLSIQTPPKHLNLLITS